ncbi:hypothetical protein [Jatrophihabitans sp.]|uniref:hypothetical protein n=1 Tax=Jatrophihabitans sp. TaxID=1932789 RepID=UPI0038CD5599
MLALGLLAGCAAAPGAGSTADLPGGASDGIGRAGPAPSGNPDTALARWQSFPVDASPRPLVLTSGMVLDPSTGFATDEDKMAYGAGQYELGVALPAAPPTSDGYPVVSAKAALDRLRANVSGQQVSSRLKIVKASLTGAKFSTDRGLQQLPAWEFSLAGVAGGVRVLAVDQSRLWPAKPLEPSWPGDQTTSIAADDQTLTYSFTGSPAGPSPCGAEYAGKVTESPTAAVISVEVVTPNPAGDSTPADQACNSIAAHRTVTVRLATPLGDRVLLTAEGTPIAMVKR